MPRMKMKMRAKPKAKAKAKPKAKSRPKRRGLSKAKQRRRKAKNRQQQQQLKRQRSGAAKNQRRRQLKLQKRRMQRRGQFAEIDWSEVQDLIDNCEAELDALLSGVAAFFAAREAEGGEDDEDDVDEIEEEGDEAEEEEEKDEDEEEEEEEEKDEDEAEEEEEKDEESQEPERQRLQEVVSMASSFVKAVGEKLRSCWQLLADWKLQLVTGQVKFDRQFVSDSADFVVEYFWLFVDYVVNLLSEMDADDLCVFLLNNLGLWQQYELNDRGQRLSPQSGLPVMLSLGPFRVVHSPDQSDFVRDKWDRYISEYLEGNRMTSQSWRANRMAYQLALCMDDSGVMHDRPVVEAVENLGLKAGKRDL